MNPDIAARLREFGQLLDDVDDAWQFVADTLIDGPEEGGEAVDNLIDTLKAAK